MTSFLKDRDGAVAAWLWAVAGLVFAMLVVGGATRLTGSGLSITEWRPVTGVVPPLGQSAWQAEFAKYQHIPQFRLVNPDMTLAGFKSIYWWEWAHRLLGRLVGAAFAIPFVIFLVLRRIPSRLVVPCVILFLLGGLQGLVGWWMVASGLEARVYVAPERLATHLGLALILYAALIWTGLEAWAGQARQKAVGPWGRAAGGLLALAFIQCLLGALVAGNHAGLAYNDWPLMNGSLFPRDYAGQGVWATFAHSQAAVQFNHRLVAYLLLALAAAFTVVAARSRLVQPQVRTLAFVLLVAVLLQAALGVAALMMQVPLALGALHQAGAAVVLAVATATAWRARRT